MNALAHTLRSWGRWTTLFSQASHWDCAHMLIYAGADIFSHDDCDCPCSASGCTATQTLAASFQSKFSVDNCRDIFTTLEWLYLVDDCGREEDLKTQFMLLIRRARFNELGMTHTCCDRHKNVILFTTCCSVGRPKGMSSKRPKLHRAEKSNNWSWT